MSPDGENSPHPEHPEHPEPSEPTERPALWDETPRHDWSSTPLGRRYDVAVVGAGLVGLATAIELAERGASVVVLEARHVGAGASGPSSSTRSRRSATRPPGSSRSAPT